MPETNRWGSYLEGELAVQRLAGVGRQGLKAGQMYHAGIPAGESGGFCRFNNSRCWRPSTAKDACGRLSAPASRVFCGDRRRTLQIDGYGHPDDPLLANRVQHEAMRALVIDLVGLDCGA